MEDLNQLRVFVEVARKGSFSAAARALNMPRSTVSRWVGELERQLGIRLLQRTTRTLQLTEVGRGYYERGLAAIELANAANAWAHSRADVPQGTLRITTFQLFADTLLGPILVDYLADNPGVSVQVVIGERNIDLVDEHIDVAIRIGTLSDSSLVVRKLAKMEGWMLACPSYLDRCGTPEHPTELSKHSCMAYGHSTTALTLPFSSGAERIEVTLPSRCVGNSVGLIRQVTLGGLGIGFLPPMLAHDDVAAGRLVRELPEWDLSATPIYAAYPSRAHLPQKVRAFVDLLAARVTSEAVQGSQ